MAKNSNIFDESARQTKHFSSKEEKALKDAPMPPLPFAHLEAVIKKIESQKISVFENNDVAKILEHYTYIHDEIERKLEEACQKLGLNMKDVDIFLNNPNHFNDNEEWARVQRERKALMKTLKTKRDVLAEEESEKNKSSALISNTEHDPKLAKERRNKIIGARRNWISMR